jgi:hypothetical protein
MQDDFDYDHIANNGTLDEQLRNESFVAYFWLVRLPAWILGVITNVILFPIYLLWMMYSAVWFAIHHIGRPEELFRNMRNAEF